MTTTLDALDHEDLSAEPLRPNGTEVPDRSLTYRQILDTLPHRPPILLVDRVPHLTVGESIVAEKAVNASEPCYVDIADYVDTARDPRDADAFGDERFAYPAALIIESLGQAAAILWRTSVPAGDGTLVFGGIRNCSFHAHVYPGDVLQHRVRIDALKGDFGILSGHTEVAGQVVAEVESMLVALRPLADRQNPSEEPTTTAVPTTGMETS
ncbi:beta-hydroxyacyl-ACP dehydratase [Rhodococcus sp. 06-235-1A]|uniref:3-hydroxyacyl-ACP dehydratase FabZ family protein n=1 Tax=unclassified Rhodococcus (in: high G+C Gram-positive bacteria) TaxID=192944 RepID=UPI0005D9360D|nr:MULTISPECIES: beta-hydroxyacyl-ACP dehydratase [unclassified Rhodococcus (in: high G+C Gram-positive bacteria)]AJW41272.1 3-hydroxyacyl-[acyl-carrier-protein] dehydratase, FabZ form [Rhodococcus sp. B7740]OZD08139.1 beta-hydroxyacyl-ACP dehydratase [Rhodococcus sp. 06-235-1A]